MSLTLNYNMQDVKRLGRRIQALAGIDRNALLEGIASEVEEQTRRRLTREKESPDGTPWPAWSLDYDATRHGGHKLLENEGHLVGSIQSIINDDSVEVGSNLIYAAIHNEGGEEGMAPGPAGIPQREFLGFSSDNLTDLQHVVDDFIDDALKDVLQ